MCTDSSARFNILTMESSFSSRTIIRELLPFSQNLLHLSTKFGLKQHTILVSITHQPKSSPGKKEKSSQKQKQDHQGNLFLKYLLIILFQRNKKSRDTQYLDLPMQPSKMTCRYLYAPTNHILQLRRSYCLNYHLLPRLSSSSFELFCQLLKSKRQFPTEFTHHKPCSTILHLVIFRLIFLGHPKTMCECSCSFFLAGNCSQDRVSILHIHQ